MSKVFDWERACACALEVRATRHILSSRGLTIDSLEGKAPRHQGRRERQTEMERVMVRIKERERSDVETHWYFWPTFQLNKSTQHFPFKDVLLYHIRKLKLSNKMLCRCKSAETLVLVWGRLGTSCYSHECGSVCAQRREERGPFITNQHKTQLRNQQDISHSIQTRNKGGHWSVQSKSAGHRSYVRGERSGTD